MSRRRIQILVAFRCDVPRLEPGYPCEQPAALAMVATAVTQERSECLL